VKRFLRLWFVVGFSYVSAKLLVDLALMGWIDLRWNALLELALLPLAQTVVLWAVTRRTRRAAVADGAAA